jgi:hypothetical protein
MVDVLWFTVEEGVQWLRETEVFEWTPFKAYLPTLGVQKTQLPP